MTFKPFRWNIKKREQLGRLLDGEVNTVEYDFLDELRECTSKVLSRSGGGRMVFVGRSPENYFDYLSGILAGTSWEAQVDLLPFSMRNIGYNSDFTTVGCVARGASESYAALRELFRQFRIIPNQLIAGGQHTVFVDLVWTGGTFGNLYEFLIAFAEESRASTKKLGEKIRFLGITERTKTSPNTQRWWQNAEWSKRLPPSSIINVSIDRSYWGHLGNNQSKTTLSHYPERWTSPQGPQHSAEQLQALRFAVYLYELGCTREEREKFCRLMSERTAMKESWFRSLLGEIKRG